MDTETILKNFGLEEHQQFQAAAGKTFSSKLIRRQAMCV